MDKIDLEQLETATKIAAYIVEQYGEKYWPLFARLDKELRDRQKRTIRLAQYH